MPYKLKFILKRYFCYCLKKKYKMKEIAYN